MKNITQVWDVEAGTILHTFHTSQANTVVGSPHHSLVVVGASPDGFLCDAARGRCFPLGSWFDGVAFMPDGGSFLTGLSSERNGLEIWDLKPVLEPGHDGEMRGETGGQKLNLATRVLEGPQVRLQFLNSVRLTYWRRRDT